MADLPVDLLTLQSLDPQQVERRLTILENVLEELGMGVEVRHGFLRDYVLRVHSALLEAAALQLDLAGASLNPLAAPPGTAFEASTLEAVAGGYGVFRRTAQPSRGVAIVTLRHNRSLVIPRLSQFVTEDGVLFHNIEPIIVRDLAQFQAGGNEVPLQPSATGDAFEFELPLQAIHPGVVSSVFEGAAFTSLSAAIIGLLSIRAKGNFQIGTPPESDAELLSRVRRSLSAKSLSTRGTTQALLHDPDRFPFVHDVRVIGSGDEEMLRGSGLGAGAAGPVDIYIKQHGYPSRREVTVQATAIEVDPTNTSRLRWTASISSKEAAGGYWIQQLQSDSLADIHRLDWSLATDAQLAADVIYHRDSDLAFSAFQTLNLTFSTLGTPHAVGDSEPVTVTLVGTPEIAQLQELVDDRRQALLGSNPVVKAAVPTFVSVSVSLHRSGSLPLPAQSTLKQAVANYINASRLGDYLHTSRIATLVNNQLPDGVDVVDVTALLETVLPDGSLIHERATGVIEPPTRPELGVTSQVTALYCRVEDVQLALAPENH